MRRHDSGVALTCTTQSRVGRCAAGCQAMTSHSVNACFACRRIETVHPARGGLHPHAPRYQPPPWDRDPGVRCEDFSQRLDLPTHCVPVNLLT